MSDLLERLFCKPIDAASLAVFRMMFGGIILFEAVNYGVFLCLDCLYRDTEFLFKYHHFEWVSLLPGIGLELVFLLMGLAAIGVMLGLFYRVCTVVLFLSFAYVFFLDQALYLNHYYLTLLFAGILVFQPAHRYWSLDARRLPAIRSETVPAWTRFWLVAQLEIVLLYAGLVKLTSDWLQLEPMRLWMTSRSADAAPLFQWLTQDWGIAVASYGAIALHLIGAPLLLFKRTRLAVFGLYCVFHTTNALVFDIGIFPFLTVAATLMLFDPDWPRQLGRRLSSRLPFLAKGGRAAYTVDVESMSWSPVRSLGMCLVVIWLVLQIVVPLRHHFRPGDVAWNEDGHRFSWRMKLRSKRGTAQFYIKYDNGRILDIDPSMHLTRAQYHKMSCIPDLIWQYAQFLEERYRRSDEDDPAVHVISKCSLNTREAVPLVSELVDLTEISRTEESRHWLLPNTQPLPRYVF